MVGVSRAVRRPGHEQDGDVGNGAEIANTAETARRQILHGDGEQPGEDTLHRRSLAVHWAKAVRTIGDLGTNTGTLAEQVVAAFLPEEFGMGNGTNQKALLHGAVVMDRAGVLLIGDAGAPGGHFAATKHLQFGGTDHDRALDFELGIGAVSGMSGHDGLSVQMIDDKSEKGLAVITGISADRLDRQREDGQQRFQQGDRQRAVFPMGWLGSLPERQLGFGIDDDVIAVAPEKDRTSARVD